VKKVGWVATILIIVAVVGAVVIGVRSIPDARRYAEIRRM
jgi:Family of unknown function (DUF6893)